MGLPRLTGAFRAIGGRVATLRRRGQRVERYDRAVAGLGVAWVFMAAGAWMVFGLGWALLVAGAELAAYFLLPYDVDRPLPTAARTDLPGPLRRFAELPDTEEAGL